MDEETKFANVPAWAATLDDREWAQVIHAIHYAKHCSKAGVPGHGQFMLIAKLVDLLDKTEKPE